MRRRKNSDKKPPQDPEVALSSNALGGLLCGGERFEFSHLHDRTFEP
jgi:hypothetical protein